jgi:hypothetical protein
VISGKSVEDILKQYDTGLPRLRTLLIRLDQLGLIELHPDDKIVPLVSRSVRWLVDGPLNEKYGQEIRHDFTDSTFAAQDEKFWLISGELSQASRQIFSRKLDLLMNEFQELIELDKHNAEDSRNITFFAAHRPWFLPLFKSLTKI